MPVRSCASIVLAAGKGTRMRSNVPKVLHPLLGRPLVVHTVNALEKAGLSPIVVVVGHGAVHVRAAVGQRDGRVRFVEQREQLGTGHATAVARDALADFTGDVLVLPGDVPLVEPATLVQFLEAHRTGKAPVTVLTIRLPDPAHYGRIVRSDSGAVLRIVEARDATPEELAIEEVNSGVYAVDARFLFSALNRLDRENAQGEYYLTDIVAIARNDGLEPAAWLHTRAEELAGVNDRAELAAAEARLRRTINEQWMKQGVTILDPNTTRIELDVTLSQDVVLEPAVQLLGNTQVAEKVRIGTGTIARNLTIGRNTQIGPYCVLSETTLDADTVLPPFTHLQPTDRDRNHA